MEIVTTATSFDFMPQSEKDRRMKRWIVTGDSRELPVTIRHRATLYELKYKRLEPLMFAVSVPWIRKLTDKSEVAVIKDGARKVLYDWLDRNDISRASVEVFGTEVKADYENQVIFRVQALVKRPVSLFVPPWGDDWWDRMKG